MTLEEIEEFWDTDSQIDRTQLHEESLKIPYLHSKYNKIYNREKLILKKQLKDLEILKNEKFEFITEGETKETRDKGWIFPGRKLKSEANAYVNVDKDIIELTLRVDLQQQKVSFLEAIFDDISKRSFNIGNAIKWHQFLNGQ